MRFGVMLPNTETLPRYRREVLEHLGEIEDVSPELLIVGRSPRTERSLLRRARCSQILFQAYKTFVLSPPASQRVRLPSHYRDLPKIQVQPRLEGKYSEYFPEAAVREIRSYELDFIIRFAFGILRGDVLEAARYGVWSFHHDDERRYRGGPPGFWEVYRKDQRTGFILQRLTEDLDAGVILARGSVSTDQTSYQRNLSRALLASTELPARVCRQILKSGELPVSPSTTEAPIYTYPTNGQFLRFCGKMLVRRLKSAVGKPGR